MATNTITSVYQGGVAFKADVKGHDVIIDLDKAGGGNDLGTSPKILMLVSLAGCTGLDVVGILNKMKVTFSDLSINVHAHLTEVDPKIYDEVTVTYTIKVHKKDEGKVQKAVTLSQDKYCGVSEMFRAFAKLSHTIIFI
ncbi:OsmC family protein [Ginsengibacter hankyongi]|uniref:OsmC family protein n=1 Tax=Ginsengibacter hankyongi TaxID=2607284 RepID=A0A5J5ING4_9BACT|nr:OsmC family protein [Ginsengibacter hankyongi]KAA9041052.1 OsmC family protein [Ginsengibacter hankyongi]